MKTSELIARLENSLLKYGDLPILVNYQKLVGISWYSTKGSGKINKIVLYTEEVEKTKDRV